MLSFKVFKHLKFMQEFLLAVLWFVRLIKDILHYIYITSNDLAFIKIANLCAKGKPPSVGVWLSYLVLEGI